VEKIEVAHYHDLKFTRKGRILLTLSREALVELHSRSWSSMEIVCLNSYNFKEPSSYGILLPIYMRAIRKNWELCDKIANESKRYPSAREI
jgi:hypothetical protein